MTTTRTYTDDDMDHLRSQLKMIMQAEDISQADLARKIGIVYGTFTPWMGKKYQGNNQKLAAQVDQWLTSRDQQQEVVGTLPTTPGYIQTKTAREITDLLTFAQAAPDYVTIVGAPGVGKTSAIREYREHNRNVFIVTAEPTIRSPHTLLAALCDEIGVLERRSDRRSHAICKRLRDTNALIIIDEAQHCSTAGLEQIRALHDAGEIGIALVGSESVTRRLHGGGGWDSAPSAQLTSRVGMRLIRSRPYERDIGDLIDAWGIEDRKVQDRLLTVGKRPGALRLLTKVLRVATMMAGGSSSAVTEEHVRIAHKQLDPRLDSRGDE